MYREIQKQAVKWMDVREHRQTSKMGGNSGVQIKEKIDSRKKDGKIEDRIDGPTFC